MDREEAIEIDKIINYAIGKYKKFMEDGGSALMNLTLDEINEKCFNKKSNKQQILLYLSTAFMHQGIGVFNSSAGLPRNEGIGIGPAIIKFHKNGGMLGVFERAVEKQQRENLEREINIKEKGLNIQLQEKVIKDYPETKERSINALKLAKEANEISKEKATVSWVAIVLSSLVFIFEIVKLVLGK